MSTTPIVRTKTKDYWASEERPVVCAIVQTRLNKPTMKEMMDNPGLQHQLGRLDMIKVESQLGMVDTPVLETRDTQCGYTGDIVIKQCNRHTEAEAWSE